MHVKVNTGLNRLGFEPHELVDAIEDFLHISEIEIAGVFSHLSSAEELDSPYTMHQLDIFERALPTASRCWNAREIMPIRHIAASAAAMLWPQTRLDMSRFGIALYGLWPSPQTREALRPAGGSSRCSRRSHIRPNSSSYASIAAGAPVGYGATFHAPHDMRIGVVPVGYGDGVPRALSNRGAFLVDGALCPIVGRVAMNMTEIDLTHAPARARRLDGHAASARDGEPTVSADDWATWGDTINYEIVARLPAELPREYIDRIDLTRRAAATRRRRRSRRRGSSCLCRARCRRCTNRPSTELRV